MRDIEVCRCPARASKGKKCEAHARDTLQNRAMIAVRRSIASTWLALLALACGASDKQSSEGAGTSTGGSGAGPFTLLFRDDFDTLDSARWQLMTHSWDSNLALFSAQTVTTEDGALVARLLPAPDGTVDSTGAAKRFLGAEVRSRDTLTYGRVRARIKFAGGSAVISSLVTIYTPWPADNWNELDIECLGETPPTIQYNSQVYTGPPTMPPVTTPVSPTPDVFMDTLDFDPSQDFHVYTIEWTPESVRYLIDDEVRNTWTRNIALMKLPQNVLLTIWASSASSWAGPVTDATSEAKATYDWIELYRYSP
jgi:beta-glucanase (GH16 family)